MENNKSQIEHSSCKQLLLVITELMKRRSRSNNIRLFNFSEEDSHKDLENTKNIFSNLNKNILSFKFSRFGKMKSTTLDKPRPVKMHLPNLTDVLLFYVNIII